MWPEKSHYAITARNSQNLPIQGKRSKEDDIELSTPHCRGGNSYSHEIRTSSIHQTVSDFKSTYILKKPNFEKKAFQV